MAFGLRQSGTIHLFVAGFRPPGANQPRKDIFTLLPQADGYCLERIAYVVLFKKQTYD
jgi:hypothetical protein